MVNLPSGTVTFLFTDIEGSTRLWQADPDAMRLAIDRHLSLLGEAIATSGGVHFKTVGDAIQAAFPTANAALTAAVAAQQSVIATDWGDLGSLLVRMALHAGSATPVDGDYLAPCLNRLSRLLGIGHGGQVLLSETTRRLLDDPLPVGVALRDLGEHRLRDLLEPERVWQIVAAGLPAQFPTLSSFEARPHNLPTPATPLVGREADVIHVMQLLEEGARLVTLTGPGGSGKTRLALEVAAELLETFVDGIWFLDLAALTDPTLILPTIATTVGIRESGGQSLRERLVEHLGGKRVLLVLDNLEQFRPFDEVGRFVSELLSSVPGLAVLATSRAPLQLRLEREVPVPPLPVPDPEATLAAITSSPAVQLFVERARAARPGFALTSQNAEVIAALCRRLDGLPLAVELVAARVRALSPADILARLGDRLDLAVDRGVDRADRHRTLEATVAWSHDLLSPAEQAAFRWFAVFAGGSTLEAAEVVLGAARESVLDVPASLEILVEQALLRVEEQADGSLRYRMLETVRAFGLEQLRQRGEDTLARQAHAELFRSLVPVAPPELWAARDERARFDQLEIEHDNLRAALNWMLASKSQELLAFTKNLAGFWWERGHGNEARIWLEHSLRSDIRPLTIERARVQLRLAFIISLQGNPLQALALTEESLHLARKLDSREDVAAALGALGSVFFDRGDFDRAAEHFRESRDLYHDLGNQAGIGWASWKLSWVAEARSDIVEMETLAETVLRIARELGQTGAIAGSLQQLGRAAKLRGELDRAEAYFVEVLGLIEHLGMLGPVAEVTELLGDVAREQAKFDQAHALLVRSQAIYKQLGWTRAETMVQYRLAILAADTGDLREGARLCAQILAELRKGDWTWGLATVLVGTGWIRLAQDDPATAASSFHEGLSLFRTIGNPLGEAAAVHAIGAVAAYLEHARQSARLLGAAATKREAYGVALVPSERNQEARAMLRCRAALGDAGFTDAWEAGRVLSWDDAIAESLALAQDIAASTAQHVAGSLLPPTEHHDHCAAHVPDHVER